MPASQSDNTSPPKEKRSSTAGSLKRLRSTSPCVSEGSSRESDSCSEVSYALSSFETRRNENKPLRIAIEGNIAAGKSTFIKILQDLADEQPDYHWYVQPEPLAKWTKKKDLEITEVQDKTDKTTESKEEEKEIDDGGSNLLDAFYKNPERWAYTFEAYTFVTRMKQAKDAEREVQQDMNDKMDSTPNAITFFERSVYSSRLVFAENSFESGFITSTEWALYCDWTNYIYKTVKELKLDGIIYLQCDPTVCKNRMNKRSRSEEGGVPIDYLIQLHDKYENWLNGWMEIKDSAKWATPPRRKRTKGAQNGDSKEKESGESLIISNITGIHSVVERTLQDVPVLVLNCTEEFKENSENRERMISSVRDWLATRIVVGPRKDGETDEAGDDNVLQDISNKPAKQLFKSTPIKTTTNPKPSTDNHSDEENDNENSATSQNLPTHFKKAVATTTNCNGSD